MVPDNNTKEIQTAPAFHKPFTTHSLTFSAIPHSPWICVFLFLFICRIYFSSCSFIRSFSQLSNCPTHNLFPKPIDASSGPLQPLANLIVCFFWGFFLCKILNRLSRTWCPVGKRWRYIGTSIELLCIVVRFGIGCIWTHKKVWDAARFHTHQFTKWVEKGRETHSNSLNRAGEVNKQVRTHWVNLSYQLHLCYRYKILLLYVTILIIIRKTYGGSGSEREKSFYRSLTFN